MKILCFGSLNIDYTYRVPHFVRPGETLAAASLARYSGGKGLNQAIALARAGAPVFMAGAIGEDGRFLLEELQAAGADTQRVCIRSEERTGHAIIQNESGGDNCILLYGGANRTITQAQIAEALVDFSAGDYLLLQNEINALPYLMEQAHQKGMKLCLNPSPMEQSVLKLPLAQVDYFLLNRGEAEQLLAEENGCRTPIQLLRELRQKFPGAGLVLTLGGRGAWYADAEECFLQPACPAEAVDTTGAGDTFTGFFLAALMQGQAPRQAMAQAAQAAAIAVSRRGAATSIPTLAEVQAAMEKTHD